MIEKSCNELTATPILLPLRCSMGIWDGGGRELGKGEVKLILEKGGGGKLF